MIDGGPSSEVPEDSSQHEELPDRLRVHSLARALGTTSRQVLDALTELDGRIRSAHSTVERVDAVRVRDLLASAPATVTTTVVATEASAPGDADEPESRTMLETTTIERPEYMPLFVAPQPVERPKGSAVAEDPADSDDDDDFDGDSETLSGLLVSPALAPLVTSDNAVHINANFANQTSDHDPLLADITFPR